MSVLLSLVAAAATSSVAVLPPPGPLHTSKDSRGSTLVDNAITMATLLLVAPGAVTLAPRHFLSGGRRRTMAVFAFDGRGGQQKRWRSTKAVEDVNNKQCRCVLQVRV